MFGFNNYESSNGFKRREIIDFNLYQLLCVSEEHDNIHIRVITLAFENKRKKL